MRSPVRNRYRRIVPRESGTRPQILRDRLNVPAQVVDLKECGLTFAAVFTQSGVRNDAAAAKLRSSGEVT
jgi:hypothetical protein